MPNYAILVDIRDRPSSQITYVPEENIEVITNTKVLSDCAHYFNFVLTLAGNNFIFGVIVLIA